MGFSFIHSSTAIGLNAELINVEVDISSGLPAFKIVGLPDTAISESRERVRAAIKNSGYSFPRTRVTVNLAPADIKKQGPAFDLPIAISILSASGVISLKDDFKNSIFIGELALTGKVRAVNGSLLAAILTKEKKFPYLFVPKDNAKEASLVNNINIIPVNSLTELIDILSHETELISYCQNTTSSSPRKNSLDMSHIKGQEFAKRALEITAAGGHNVLLSGPPGSGKTMLARALPSILPIATFEEALEITKIHSISGIKISNDGLITVRPFRSPHHTSSNVALIGGGSWPKPGEVSLAHNGVLFLDEFPEFTRQSIENLRQPLEDGFVTISRAAGTIKFPAKFMLVAAMNPCPCGFTTDLSRTCICTPNQVLKYKQKISGPIMDRIDLSVHVPQIDYDKLTSNTVVEKSNQIRKRVQSARKIQQLRYKTTKIKCNAELMSNQLKIFCKLNKECDDLMRKAVTKLHLSARSYTRLLKVARTIADISSSNNIEIIHLAEALQYKPRIRENI